MTESSEGGAMASAEDKGEITSPEVKSLVKKDPAPPEAVSVELPASTGWKKKMNRAVWTYELHKGFVDICVELVRKGHRPGTHLSKEGYRRLSQEFQKRTGRTFTRSQFKNHWDSIKDNWKVWQKLTAISEVGWDPIMNTVSASVEFWEEYLKANPAAAQFRHSGLPHAKELDIIYGGTATTGAWELSPSSGHVRDLPEGPGSSSQPSHYSVDIPDNVEDILESAPETHPPIQPLNSRPQFSPPRSQPPRPVQVVGSEDDVFVTPSSQQRKGGNMRRHHSLAAHLTVQRSIDRLVNAYESVKKSKNDSSSVTSQDKTYSITDCIHVLMEIPGVKENKRLWFVTIECFRDATIREIFMALEDAQRADWLRMKFPAEAASWTNFV